MITLRVVEPEPVGLGVANAEVNPVLTHNHAELTNLDYEHSGHTGFASLAGLAAETSARQAADSVLNNAVNAKYTKPHGGIPKRDLSSAVQASLDKADTSLQEHQSLVDYATKAWVEAKGYITSLAGYATEAWVTAKNYATQSWVEAKGYLTEHQSLSSYRTAVEQDVIDGGKQNTITAGSNISIIDNVISATDTTYISGQGINISGNVISNTQTSAEWGNVTGDITDQSDLQDALELKQNNLVAGTGISIIGTTISSNLATEGDTMFSFDTNNGNLYMNATDSSLEYFDFSINGEGCLIMEYEE